MTLLQYLPVATLLFAASAATLSGENLCHKREMYTVSMRVLVKEPVQVKSYTWCLQVPPRCTKYKIEMRDRYKIQTEIRERVVDVCCAGYVPDRLQTLCIPVCRGCLHGVCGTPDTCYCEPGYTGDHCDIECRKGFWGSACAEECQCQNGAICNHVTGDCKCTDGWRGILCDVPCPRGTYGHACMKECECPASNNNGGNITCDHVTGKCTSSQEEFPLSSNATPSDVLLTTALPVLNPITTNEATTNEPTNLKPASDREAIGNQYDGNTNEDGNNRSVEHITHTPSKSNVLVDSAIIPLESTRTSILPTDSFLLPRTEKHISSTDDKLTTQTPTISTTLLTINTTVPTTTTLSTIITSVPTILQPTLTEDKESQQTHSGIDNSATNHPSLEGNNNESNGAVTEVINNKSYSQEHTEKEQDDGGGGSDKDDDDVDNMLEVVKNEQTTEQITTEPQNIQLPPHGIIVVSDGLMSERTEEDDGEESKSGVWNLVSSVSVAGGVALALILMAAMTLMISHRRNRIKITTAENKAEDFRRQQLEQEQQPPQITGPQMYTYTEDVSPAPLRNPFPDAAYQLNANRPRPEGLQLHFGDVTNTATTNNNHDPPYHDMRAYLELQYDIPPSSISSKSNSLLPGMEPEHLYDEIPCWRNNTTTSTNTDTDTSPC